MLSPPCRTARGASGNKRALTRPALTRRPCSAPQSATPVFGTRRPAPQHDILHERAPPAQHRANQDPPRHREKLQLIIARHLRQPRLKQCRAGESGGQPAAGVRRVEPPGLDIRAGRRPGEVTRVQSGRAQRRARSRRELGARDRPQHYSLAPSAGADARRHESMLAQALDIVTPTQDVFMIALISNNLAVGRLDAGDIESARLSTDALGSARRINFRSVVTSVRSSLPFGRLAGARRAGNHLVAACGARARTRADRGCSPGGSPYSIEPNSILLAVAGAFATATQQPTFAAKLW
jgi:hypothetical protein